MDESEELQLELAYLMFEVSPRFLAIMQPFAMLRPHASMQRLVQDLAILPAPMGELVATAAAHFPQIRPYLARDFGETVRVLYYGLKTAQTRVMAGRGGEQGRPPTTRYTKAFVRGAHCALTGLTSDDEVKYELAHIVPWSVGRWHDGEQFSFFRLINMLFGEHIGAQVWALSGGRNVNHIENLMSLSPDMHKLFDSGVLRLEPTTVSNGGQGFSVVFRRAPRYQWFWTIVNGNGCVPLHHGLILDKNSAGCGSAGLHWVVNQLEWLAHGFDFNSGRSDQMDLGGLWHENFV
jgi:hypothetical protein